MHILFIVMPAYNEESNIKAVVSSWYTILKDKAPESRLVVADSGSSDRTHEILLSMKNQYPQLEFLENTDKQHGPKVLALYHYAITQGADYIFQTDSDGQTNPEEFSFFWEHRKEYDAIFGNRTVRGDGKQRAFIEKVVCLLVKYFFNVNVPDANAPFRLMNTQTLKKYLHKIPTDYNIPNIIITSYFARYQERILFKEITFKPRQGG